jgi:hypothetical protein
VFPTNAASTHRIPYSNTDRSNCKQRYPFRGESERIVLLVVIYFTITLLPVLNTVSAFDAPAGPYRRLTQALLEHRRIGYDVEPIRASA